MGMILRYNDSWPSKPSDELGIKDGLLVPPESLDDPEVLEFGSKNVIVTPGWINAHGHLELTGIGDVEYNDSFVEWIYDVIDYKESIAPEDILEGYRDATDRLLTSGVTRVVDHCDRTDLVLDILDEIDLNVHLQKELIAFNDQQIESLKDEINQFIEELDERELTGGLAPHAPYSAHPEVYDWAARRVGSNEYCLSTHMHEVESELEFSESGTGDLLRLLEDRTQRQMDSPYEGSRPIPYLVRQGVFDRAAFGVHLNYLTGEDLRWLKASRICPVFCPRSYTYFNHTTRPIQDWIDEGIGFALGTDSLASNDDLNMLEELRRLDEIIDAVGPDTILEALTINPAEVINMPGRGVLTWGTPADLSVFEVPSGTLKDLVRGRAEPLATILDGRVAWKADGA